MGEWGPLPWTEGCRQGEESSGQGRGVRSHRRGWVAGKQCPWCFYRIEGDRKGGTISVFTWERNKVNTEGRMTDGGDIGCVFF